MYVAIQVLLYKMYFYKMSEVFVELKLFKNSIPKMQYERPFLTALQSVIYIANSQFYLFKINFPSEKFFLITRNKLWKSECKKWLKLAKIIYGLAKKLAASYCKIFMAFYDTKWQKMPWNG